MSQPTGNAREREIREAEELLGQAEGRSFAKPLFFGRFVGDLAFPYPELDDAARAERDAYLGRVREFLAREVDAAAIDRQARIPEGVIRGLFDLGVMSMSIPREHGGLGFSQRAYCRVLEEIGAADSSVAILVNAHQSIGIRSLLLFGTTEQQRLWLPRLCRENMLAAFALTEPNAGSDAGGIETRAVPSADGSYYTLNGEKLWITNGSTAGLLTVMAKVPNTKDKKGRDAITAFLVTPDMPGFTVVEAAMEKCGIRGTATSRLAFKNVRVPAGNIIGPPGKGLRVALTVLDFGRTTFGASCTGAAKRCLADAIQHAKTRHQFGKSLASFGMVKRKLARMAALTFAMESGTYLTAGLIDRGVGDYMVETAMLKVFASDSLWEIVNETIQIFGGRAYFTDLPYERMMRDARINLIGEGANDVMRTFIALVGMRDVGYGLKGVLEAIRSPILGFGKLAGFVGRHIPGLESVTVPVLSHALVGLGEELEELTLLFGRAVERQLIRHRENILEMQLIQKRIADSATELYMISATLSRLDAILKVDGGSNPRARRQLAVGRYYCRWAGQRIRKRLGTLTANLDSEIMSVADALLE